MEMLFANILSCAFLTGLIWTIQLIHYPAFSYVKDDRFQDFHAFHSRNISVIVMPIMLVELATGLGMVLYFESSEIPWINLTGIVLIWLSTFLVSVPLHNLLAKSKDQTRIDRLTTTNWIRTLLWSARLGLLIFFLLKNFEVNDVSLKH